MHFIGALIGPGGKVGFKNYKTTELPMKTQLLKKVLSKLRQILLELKHWLKLSQSLSSLK
jgi:hypothetical protein